MVEATVVVDPDAGIGEVDRRLFGSFVEHMGRCVYTGLFEPSHATADACGFRGDVLELVRELGPTVVRYPGGNFVSTYRWEDGIGPRADRPPRLDLAWRQLESNEFGLNEFIRWAREANVDPILVVNLATRGVLEAADLVEYCNHPAGTHLSNLRRSHGFERPHDIRIWGLGNELDGAWQVGARPAEDYGRIAGEAAKAMRRVDDDIELIVAGSSNRQMSTYGASSMDSFIEEVASMCDQVAARVGIQKRIQLAFDEWNVWYQSRFATQKPAPWTEAPRLIEDEHGAVDAVVIGSLLSSLIRHADRVKIGCQAQLVNVIAPIRTEPGGAAWRQPSFYPFALASKHARGRSIAMQARVSTYATAEYGDIPLLDIAATVDEESRTLSLFAVNRHQTDELVLHADLKAFDGWTLIEHIAIHDKDPRATNSALQAGRVVPQVVSGTALIDGMLVAKLPPVSWSLLRLGAGAAN